jgi:hypothetical protein
MSIAKPIITALVGILLWLIAIAIDQVHYRVPGGYTWTASRQLLACNQATALTGSYPGTPGCLHARELVGLSHLLPVAGLVLIVTGTALVIRGRRRRAAIQASMSRHPSHRRVSRVTGPWHDSDPGTWPQPVADRRSA